MFLSIILLDSKEIVGLSGLSIRANPFVEDVTPSRRRRTWETSATLATTHTIRAWTVKTPTIPHESFVLLLYKIDSSDLSESWFLRSARAASTSYETCGSLRVMRSRPVFDQLQQTDWESRVFLGTRLPHLHTSAGQVLPFLVLCLSRPCLSL